MATSIGQRYFDEIKKVWMPFESSHRIIPFCTPVIERPTALVIGVNHSNFAIRERESAQIAERFSEALPDTVSYLSGSFQFAEGLRSICGEADVVIDNQWVGTNRCAVQTEDERIESITKSRYFDSCQKTMDVVLKRLVLEIAPRNVLLVSYYPCELYFQKAKEKAGFEKLMPRR